MKKFSRVLPENQEMENELLEKGYNKYFDKDKKELYFDAYVKLENKCIKMED